MRSKYYKNPSLKAYFEKYVGQMSVDSRFKPILVDILLRRAFEYELSPEDIRQDISSLMINLKNIRIGEMPEDSRLAAGVYYSNSREIIINKYYVERANENPKDPRLYEILTHEVYHALSFDEYGDDRLSSINSFNGMDNVSLLEAIVEKAADRCVCGRSLQNAPYYHKNSYGYTNITFITDAIEATYGVSEKEFLKNAIMGRDRLINFLAANGNENIYQTISFLDAIECNFSRLHNTLYPEQGIIQRNRGNYASIIRNIKDSMSGIYMLCERKFLERIERANIHGPRVAKAFVQDTKFNHNKLTYVMNDALSGFSENFKRPDIKNDVYEFVERTRRRTTNRINDLDQVAANIITNIPYKASIMLIHEAQTGNLPNYDENQLRRLGISLKADKIFAESPLIRNSYSDIDFPKDTWDNNEITKYMAKTCSRITRNDYIANIFKNLLGISSRGNNRVISHTLMLDEAKESTRTIDDMKEDLQRIDRNTTREHSSFRDDSFTSNTLENSTEKKENPYKIPTLKKTEELDEEK